MSSSCRMRSRSAHTCAVSGTVVWSPLKSIWYTSVLVLAVLFAVPTFDWRAAILSAFLTSVTLCVGHSVGLHRLLIHRSFECPIWLEHIMVLLGVLVGMGGPRRILYLHDIRDWSQRQPECHPFFVHRSRPWKDWIWNLHCELKLDHPPEFFPEERVTGNRFYRFLDHYWLLVQLLLAVCLYQIGGVSFFVWGTCVRVAVSLTGHWLVGYLAHNGRSLTYQVQGAAVQGYNVPSLGMLTFGEAWHNNHHAFPGSARLGLKSGESDPGWWLLTILEGLGLVWNCKQPADLPHRPELKQVDSQNVESEIASHANVPPVSRGSDRLLPIN